MMVGPAEQKSLQAPRTTKQKWEQKHHVNFQMNQQIINQLLAILTQCFLKTSNAFLLWYGNYKTLDDSRLYEEWDNCWEYMTLKN